MFRRTFLILLLLVGAAAPAEAEETRSERSAALLLKTTVTLRVAPKSSEEEEQNAPRGVTVCSGTSLGEGLVLTFLPPNPAEEGARGSTYRVTLPGGEQAAARPLVVDQYSGLVLLKIGDEGLPGLKLADELPRIGGVVLAASASGIEKPLVSKGILSGVDRAISGASLPPVIQCDISTTEASTGAGVIDAQGRLLGIIAATEAPGQRFGWTYAIPYRHIRRVLDARMEGRLVVLARRRPSIGLQLGPGPEEGTVQVERVIAGGPADRAGVRAGDYVFAAEGRKVRSAYQVVALILKRQPGDRFSLSVGNAEKRREIEVTLGGGAAVVRPRPGAALAEKPKVRVGPQVHLRLAAPNRLELRGRSTVAELAAPGDKPPRAVPSEIELLKAQLDAYQRVIQALQEQRLQSEKQAEELRKLLEELRAEIREPKRPR